MDQAEKNELIALLKATIPEETRNKWASEMPQEPGNYTFNGRPGVWTRSIDGVWTDPSGESEPSDANFILGFGGQGNLWERVADTKLKERG